MITLTLLHELDAQVVHPAHRDPRCGVLRRFSFHDPASLRRFDIELPAKEGGLLDCIFERVRGDRANQKQDGAACDNSC